MELNVANFSKQIKEQQVLEQELKSQPKGASVYKQQPNSQIFFKTSHEKMMVECKRNLDSLIKEYKAAEVKTDPKLHEDR
ncbi:ASNSD1 upstream open reading frame protein-like [Dreissena polymorpha]|uniref:Uncharacterized protein n=1 Tax=Dreissena polymorpha TaxID=45954 RepID=A0A9D4CB71_DREPO|nr:ASNSD1 upstream open reading frame protein-like [Dreissena polymorpha]XP_052248609.1 ASNSD1 upstream open reading frame protein-like [Dreissena polymorpha]KAH3720896.1 hypothetical protein DPMN_063807 [Dreissena polymorpha]